MPVFGNLNNWRMCFPLSTEPVQVRFGSQCFLHSLRALGNVSCCPFMSQEGVRILIRQPQASRPSKAATSSPPCPSTALFHPQSHVRLLLTLEAKELVAAVKTFLSPGLSPSHPDCHYFLRPSGPCQKVPQCHLLQACAAQSWAMFWISWG